MYNKKSKNNLKPFSSDYQPKNRGRKKGPVSIVAAWKKVLAEIDPASGKQIVELLAISDIQRAMKGDSTISKEMLNRIDGKVPERPEHTGQKKPIKFTVVYEDEKSVDDEDEKIVDDEDPQDGNPSAA